MNNHICLCTILQHAAVRVTQLVYCSEQSLCCLSVPFTPDDVPVVLASEGAPRDRSPAQMAEVHVDIRQFLQLLAGQQVNPTKGICSELHLECLHIPHAVSPVIS